jgi:hypothetical protein
MDQRLRIFEFRVSIFEIFPLITRTATLTPTPDFSLPTSDPPKGRIRRGELPIRRRTEQLTRRGGPWRTSENFYFLIFTFLILLRRVAGLVRQSFLSPLPFVFIALIAALSPQSANAIGIGPTPLTPGGTVSPGLVATDPGKLLTSHTVRAFGVVFTSAVFRNAGGTLDFYYQLSNASNVSSLTGFFSNAFTFGGLATSVGYRTDGNSVLPGMFSLTGPPIEFPGVFADGTIGSSSAYRSQDGDVVGFDLTTGLMAGQSSYVFVISTDTQSYQDQGMHIAGTDIEILAYAPEQRSLLPDSGTTLLLLGLTIITLLPLRRVLASPISHPSP